MDLMALNWTNCCSARATNAPVIAAVRVPPSACSTSQSRITVRSPSTAKSTTERSARPTSRWISWVRPEGRPLLTSRGVRLLVGRGSMAYSAVTQPFPLVRRKGGTVSSTLAAQSTCVLPTLMSADPSAVARNPVTSSTERISSGRRLSVRIAQHEVHKQHYQNHGGQDQNHAGNRARRRRGSFPLAAGRLELGHQSMVAPRLWSSGCVLRVTIELMMRREWLWLAAVPAACRRAAPAPDLLPATVAGVWRRTDLREVPAADAPDPVSRTVIDRLEVASYQGPGKLEARVYQLESPGIALDLVQRWRPSADTVFFYRDKFFVVIKWQDADRKALTAFVTEMEKRLGKPNEPA